IPFTTKQELVADQQKIPPFGSNLTFPLENYTRFHQTSGTTGTPLRWLDTPESWNWMVENWVEVFRAAGVEATDKIYFAFSFGPFIGFWLAFDAGQKIGTLCVPGGGLSSESRLKAILENEITVLCCTPTYALRLAEVAGFGVPPSGVSAPEPPEGGTPNQTISPKIGLSTHAPAQAERAIAAGADYVAIGPIYATGTKPTAKPVTLDYIRWAAANVKIPWFAIGGINLQNLDEVLAAGAKRICVVSAILRSADIKIACAEFRKRLDGL
ncbi:MAG: thiamine phosphate synthase, partial [Verrucomicrobiota bacterium]